MAGDLANMLAVGNAPAGFAGDPALAQIGPQLQLAQLLAQQGMSGAPASPWQAAGRVGSALAGAIVQGQAQNELQGLYKSAGEEAARLYPEGTPVGNMVRSKSPIMRVLGMQAIPKLAVLNSEQKVLGPGAAVVAPGVTPPGGGVVGTNMNPTSDVGKLVRDAEIAAARGNPGGASAISQGVSKATTTSEGVPYPPAPIVPNRVRTVPANGPGGMPYGRPEGLPQPSTGGMPGAVADAAALKKRAEELQAGSVKDFNENSTKHYNAAQNLMGRLTTMDHDIETLGPKWMGANANAKAEFGKQWNGMLDTLGVNGHHIDPTKIATWEEFNKESARAGMELINANFGGSREAASIIKMGTEAVPAAQQTYLGAKYNAASIKAAAQREIDLHEYKARLLQEGKPIVGADVAFNRTNPAQVYAMQAIMSQIPPDAVVHLRSNPALAPQFDKRFGPGTAAFVIGTK